MTSPTARCKCGFASLLLLTMLTGCAAMSGQSVAIPEQHIASARVPDAPLSAVLTLPAGTGPFPAVILLHGCGGLSRSQPSWVERLRGWGYAVLVLDSFSARGVKSVCAPAAQPLVTARDRAADVLSAALYLRSLPEIDASRIAVLGQSHGGATAAVVTQQQYEQLYPGLLKASVDYYGSCGSPDLHGTVPLLALAGEADDWGHPAQSCRLLLSRMKPNQVVEVYTYPGVVHAFDNPNQINRVLVEGHPLEYNPPAAADSYDRVRAFLDKWVKGSAPAAT